jgi:arsenical pump membrane protein
MFSCTFIADTASFLLPVSNPINILVLNTFGSDPGTFLHYLALPALACTTLNIGIFTLIFRRSLTMGYDIAAAAPPSIDRDFFLRVLVTLLVIALAYIIVPAPGAPLSLVAIAGSLLLIGCAASAREHPGGFPRIGPPSVGHTARFVVDHAPGPVLLRGSAIDSTI